MATSDFNISPIKLQLGTCSEVYVSLSERIRLLPTLSRPCVPEPTVICRGRCRMFALEQGCGCRSVSWEFTSEGNSIFLPSCLQKFPLEEFLKCGPVAKDSPIYERCKEKCFSPCEHSDYTMMRQRCNCIDGETVLKIWPDRLFYVNFEERLTTEFPMLVFILGSFHTPVCVDLTG